MGKFNIPNAICFSNLFKYIRYLGDYEGALKHHLTAVEIFARFPPDHPNSWMIHLSNAIVMLQRRAREEAMQELQQCLRIAEKRYSPNHINWMKIQLQLGKQLKSIGYKQKAL